MISSQTISARLAGPLAEKIKRLEKEFGCRIAPVEQADQLAKLTPAQYSRVQAIENEIGVSLVAYETDTHYRLAKLSARDVGRVKELEKTANYVLVAYELVYSNQAKKAAQPFPQAALTEAQSARLQKLEEEADLVLVAYKK